jgi:hypothetical protein
MTDQTEIESETIKHFKYLGKKPEEQSMIFNNLEDLPMEWRAFYSRDNTIIAEELLDMGKSITIEELDETIKNLPNEKAPGPSKIVYEDFKMSGPKYRKELLQLFNTILSKGRMPSEWKKVTVYPIPKPKDWECKLNNT